MVYQDIEQLKSYYPETEEETKLKPKKPFVESINEVSGKWMYLGL